MNVCELCGCADDKVVSLSRACQHLSYLECIAALQKKLSEAKSSVFSDHVCFDLSLEMHLRQQAQAEAKQRGRTIHRLERQLRRRRRKSARQYRMLAVLSGVLGALLKRLQPHDSYGVVGSDFYTCLACGAGGAPGVTYEHTPDCPVGRAELELDEIREE